MQIKKKNGELRNNLGVLIAPGDPDAAKPQSPAGPPKDIPAIIEAHIANVARAVHFYSQKQDFTAKDISGLTGLTKPIAHLQLIEEARLAKIGSHRVQDLPTAQLRLLARQSAPPEADPETGDRLGSVEDNIQAAFGSPEDNEW